MGTPGAFERGFRQAMPSAEEGFAGALGAQTGGMVFSGMMQAAMLPVTMGLSFVFGKVQGAFQDIVSSFTESGEEQNKAATAQVRAAAMQQSAAEAAERRARYEEIAQRGFYTPAEIAEFGGASAQEVSRLRGLGAMVGTGLPWSGGTGNSMIERVYALIQAGKLEEAIALLRGNAEEAFWGQEPETVRAIIAWVESIDRNTDALEDLTRLQEDVWEAFRRAEVSAQMLTERSEWGRQGVYQTYTQGGGIGGTTTTGGGAMVTTPPIIDTTPHRTIDTAPGYGPGEEYGPAPNSRPARVIIEIHSGGTVVEQVVEASQTGAFVIDRYGRARRAKYY